MDTGTVLLILVVLALVAGVFLIIRGRRARLGGDTATGTTRRDADPDARL